MSEQLAATQAPPSQTRLLQSSAALQLASVAHGPQAVPPQSTSDSVPFLTLLPQLVARLSIPAMVEEKVLGFSTEKMEEIVRRVTQKELDLIVKLGYVLGALVGALAFGLNQLIA